MKTGILIIYLLPSIQGLAQSTGGSHENYPRLPIMHHFSTDEYSGGIQNWDITQDTRGLLYVANNFGLLEFDGAQWKTYIATKSTRSLSLYINQDNIIYAGGQNQLGYFKSDEDGVLKYHSLTHLIKKGNPDNVWKVIGYEGKIFFNTDEYVYIYEEGKISEIHFDVGVYIFQVARRLVAYSPKEGLLEWNGKGFFPMNNGDQMRGKSVIQILPYTNGFLVFLSDGHIYKYLDGEFTPWKTDLDDFLLRSLINTAKLISNDQIAIGTHNNGLVIFNQKGESILQLSKRRGLNSSTVHSIYEDQFKNLWIGLGNGITYVEWGSPFSIIDERLGVPGTGYSATTYNHQLYLGTTNGLFSSNKTDRVEWDSDPYTLVPGTEGQVYSIEKHGRHLLMGHHNGGFVIENNKIRQIINQKGIWRFRPNSDYSNFISGSYGGFYSINKDLTKFNKIEGFDESSRLFEFENDSVLWMSHGYKGVFKITFNHKLDGILSAKFYGEKRGFPSNLLINAFRIGNKLLFPAEYGIYEYNSDQDLFLPNEELENLLGRYEHISYLTSDHQGNIYFQGTNRLGQLVKNNFNTYDLLMTPFKSILKYVSDDLENITVIDPKNVLIGAKEGFIHYNPQQVKNLDLEFSPIFRSVIIHQQKDSVLYGGGASNRLNKKFSIHGKLNSIHFEYAAPYFDGFKDIKYQYHLENFDASWSDWSSESKKEYTNLPYGKYTFKVKAKNIYEQESAVSSITFIINPPWYLTRLAYIGYILILFFAFAVAMFILDAKHRYDKKRMEINQRRQIQQKDMQLVTVSNESKATITSLKNEKLRAEVEHKNKELASSTMHLLNKNEFMLGIKNKLDSLAKSGGTKPDEIKRIIKTIDKNIAEDEGWEQFSVHFDQVHGDFLKKLKNHYPDLTPQETKLAAYLRMNLSSKDIAQLLNISVRGVEISRYRLRKKINLERDTNLVSFMMDL